MTISKMPAASVITDLIRAAWTAGSTGHGLDVPTVTAARRNLDLAILAIEYSARPQVASTARIAGDPATEAEFRQGIGDAYQSVLDDLLKSIQDLSSSARRGDASVDEIVELAHAVKSAEQQTRECINTLVWRAYRPADKGPEPEPAEDNAAIAQLAKSGVPPIDDAIEAYEKELVVASLTYSHQPPTFGSLAVIRANARVKAAHEQLATTIRRNIFPGSK